jgi:SAM-dependent methyltransferase
MDIATSFGQPERVPCGKTERQRTGFMRWVCGHFERPTGFWGRVAGWIMSTRPSNRDRNAWVVRLLDIQTRDWVLEIGCGPGLALAHTSHLATEGYIVGVDHSEVMLQQARRRNAEACRLGRVDLRLASVSALSPMQERFDKVLSVNSVQFWDSPVERLTELRGLMRPHGTIAIALQPRWRGATDGDAQAAGHELVAQLKAAGFDQVRLEVKRMKPVSVVCAMGVNRFQPQGLEIMPRLSG